MKIENAVNAFKNGVSYLICPKCGAPFSLTEKSLVCESGHCFDISAKGYVNFIPDKKQASLLYTKRLFESRAAVFESGAFDKVYDEITDMINSRFGESRAIDLLDAGCGEGYYAARLSAEPRINVFAVDIVKDAIVFACGRKAPVKWMAADLTNIPMKDKSADVILNILASANYDEFRRVLKDGGIIIKAIPGKDHLQEIRTIVKTQLKRKDYSNEEVTEYMKSHVMVTEKRALCYKVDTDAALFKRFIEMTPMTSGAALENTYTDGISHITVNLDMIAGQIPFM
jgi:23S rRNA (guanine745-N1)-methyltransferase